MDAGEKDPTARFAPRHLMHCVLSYGREVAVYAAGLWWIIPEYEISLNQKKTYSDGYSAASTVFSLVSGKPKKF